MPGGVADNAAAAAAASAEELLREREQQYRRIFEATSDGLVVNDLETGLVVEANPAFCRMHGYSYDELIGMHPYGFIHPDDHHLFDEYVAAISEGRDFRCRAREVRKDGSLVDVEVHGTSFLFRGRVHVLGVLRDVSQEVAATRLLEQRVEERTEELSSLLALANRAATTLDLEELVAVILPEVERVMGCRAEIDVHDHAMSDQPQARSAGSLAVPLVASGELAGVLRLSRDDSQPFEEQQVTLARGVADQIAVAVSNARRYRVSQQAAALEERHRIARDLHDSISQTLFSLTLHTRTAELALGKAGLDGDGPVGRPLREVAELTRGALAEMRALIFELRPGALAEEGLAAALNKHAAAVSAREGLAISIEAPEERLPLTGEQEEHLYRLAQEALHNVVKHARATGAQVELGKGLNGVRLSVRDDGAGFDQTEPRPGHLGLETMQDRARRIGGKLTIESAPGTGTTIVVEVPVS